MDKDVIETAVAAIPYWYHRISLPHGIVTPGWAPLLPESYGIPESLEGEAVVDIGAWDGYWTFEALKRGAKQVAAVEDFSDTLGSIHNINRRSRWASFDVAAMSLGFLRHKPFKNAFVSPNLNQFIAKLDVSIEDDVRNNLPREGFHRVFMFGVLYHLRNPLRALQNCFDATKSGGWIHVETAILDNLSSPFTGKPHDPEGCYAEFYPTDEYGKNESNWWVPTLKCAAAWLQAVGYVEVEAWKLTETPSSVAECRGFLRARKK